MQKTKSIACAVVRVPVSKAALALTLQQLGACLKPGNPVVLCGHVSEVRLLPLLPMNNGNDESTDATLLGP